MPLHMTWTITGTVDDIYRPGAITAADDDSLEQIAARLRDKDISALVVLDGYRLAGIITERDLVRAVADRRDLADSTAGDVLGMVSARDLLEVAGGDGVVLFNGSTVLPARPGPHALDVVPRLVLSTSEELRLPLRRIAILDGRVTGGLAGRHYRRPRRTGRDQGAAGRSGRGHDDLGLPHHGPKHVQTVDAEPRHPDRALLRVSQPGKPRSGWR
jgi:hypothetical protein